MDKGSLLLGGLCGLFMEDMGEKDLCAGCGKTLTENEQDFYVGLPIALCHECSCGKNIKNSKEHCDGETN